MTIRLEICQKIHTTIFLDQKFYTLKTRKSGLFQFHKKVTLGVCEITKYIGVFYTSPQKMQKKGCFLETLTQLARILHNRWLRRS